MIEETSSSRSEADNIKGESGRPTAMDFPRARKLHAGFRVNPTFKKVYQRLRLAGKAAKVALVAVARKLLAIPNAIARDRTGLRTLAAA